MSGLTASGTSTAGTTTQVRQVRVLLYSDDRSTREQVMRSVGRRPARDVEVVEWKECATPVAAEAEAKAGGYDLFVFDGEAVPLGGMGLCRQLKFEVYDCPPVVVLTGRPQDAWLAAWSYAERAVPHPLDPLVLARAVADVVRESVSAS
ncbi:MAG: hypothetical protein Q4G51_12905 [Dermatophilus congolensis]|nr:hypothetical protein [Dermatophilus congolensis]